jgi:uncharacterized protein (TIGR03437 family)
MRSCLLVLFLSLSYSAAQAQTVIQAVTDAASFAPRVAPGELATIFGTNLAEYTAQAGGFPLPTSLAGATVYVNNVPVPLLYASQTQINFQVPSSLTAGTANMYVTRSGGQSALFQFTVVTTSPAIFQNTSNHAVAQNATNYSTNSDSNPVVSGQVLVVYLTGQGAVNHAVADGTATPDSPIASATGTPTATIGGVTATVEFLGLTPGFTGLAQANIVVPTLAKADYPLVITVGGYVSASAEVSVSGSGTAPPTFLTPVGAVSFANGVTNSVAIYGDYTYLCGPNQINLVNTSDVSAPAYVGSFGGTYLNGYGGKCAVNQATSEPLLVDIVGPGTAPTLAVFSLEEPESPVEIAQLSTSPYTFLTDISFLGDQGYFSTSWYQNSGSAISGQFGNFVSYDFTSLYPELVGVLSSGAGSGGGNLMPNAAALVASSNDSYPNTAYITSTTATGSDTSGEGLLDVVNISSPSAMTGVEEVTDSKTAIFLGFGYDGNLLLLAGNTTSLQNPGFDITGNLTLSTMSIGNVEAPAGIADMTTGIPTMGTYVVQPLELSSGYGSDVFALINDPPATDPTGPSSMIIVDAAAPSSPVLYSFLTQFGMGDVAEANGYLLVPNVNGLAIYTIELP